MSESTAKPTLRMARMAAAADVERHRTFLSTTEIGELSTGKRAWPPQRDEPWKIEKEWDAVPLRGPMDRVIGFFRGRGYKDEHFLPSFVTWHPEGEYVYSSPDPASLTRWDAGRGHGNTETIARWGGMTRRAYWSTHSEWVLCSGQIGSAAHDQSFVSSSRGEYCGAIENAFFRFGMAEESRYDTRPAFNPWRPFDKRFVNLPAYTTRFDLYGIEYSEKGRPRLTVEESLRLSDLDPDDRDVISYLWHPSGRYLAFASKITNRSTRNSVIRIHVMEWDTAQIVLSSQAFVIRSSEDFSPWCCAWSPGGRWLALDDQAAHIWDVRTGEALPLPAEAESSAWVRRMRAAEDTSSDGQRELRRSGDRYVVVATAGGFCFEVPAKHAKWHPTDPHRFATVGGVGCERKVRIWRLDAV
jgi:WD40 repeat protein